MEAHVEVIGSSMGHIDHEETVDAADVLRITAVSQLKKALTAIVGSKRMSAAVADLPKLFTINPQRETGIYNTYDGLIDVAYYMCDSSVRAGLHYPLNVKIVNLVREFTVGAFGAEGQPSARITAEITGIMDFVVRMCATEVVEIAFPRITADELQLLARDWCAELDENYVSDPHSVLGLCGAISELFIAIQSCFPSALIFETAFMEVHSANMRKATIIDGKPVFTKRLEGGKMKVIKPAGWTEPNIKKAIERLHDKLSQ